MSAITKHFGKFLNQYNPRIILIENHEIIKTEKGTTKLFKRFLFKYCLKPRHSAI